MPNGGYTREAATVTCPHSVIGVMLLRRHRRPLRELACWSTSSVLATSRATVAIVAGLVAPGR